MATIFVIDLERRICIARGSNVEVLAKKDRHFKGGFRGSAAGSSGRCDALKTRVSLCSDRSRPCAVAQRRSAWRDAGPVRFHSQGRASGARRSERR